MALKLENNISTKFNLTHANNAGEINLTSKDLASTKLVDSIAELKLINGSTADKLEVLGYYEKGDGGGGLFYWDSTSTEEDNGGTIIQATGVNTGRWKRVFSGAVNVKWFGAKGDGVTDDTIAIQSTIGYCNTLFFPIGTYLFTSLNVTSEHNLIFENKNKTILRVECNPSTIVFNVSLNNSYSSFTLSNFTFENTGVKGTSFIKTPQSDIGFMSENSFYFDSIFLLGSSFDIAFDIGDCSQGAISRCDIRGAYNSAITDDSQDTTIGVKLSGTKGNVGFTIDKNNIKGYRTGVVLGENTEGYFIFGNEITNGWNGIYSSMAASKPGGFIDDNHISVNKYPIFIGNRTNFNIGKNQLYRSTGMYNHAEEWVGCYIAACDDFTIENQIVRVLSEYTTTRSVGMRIASCNNFSIDAIVATEDATLTTTFECEDSNNGSVGSIIGYSPAEYNIHLIGDTRYFEVISHTIKGTIPSNPVKVNTNQKDNIRISREPSYLTNYEEVSYSVSGSETLNVDTHARNRKVNVLAGTGVYSHTINLSRDNAVEGDYWEFRVVLTPSTNGTLTIKDATSGLTNSFHNSSNSVSRFYTYKAEFNGAGWVLDQFIENIT